MKSRTGRFGVVAAVVVLALVAGGCDFFQAYQVESLRTAAGQPQLPLSALMDSATAAHAQAMCAAGVVSASPAGSYNQETATAVHELVGAAPLDPSIADVSTRDLAATAAIWSQWKSDPELVDPKWTDMGVGSSSCADGNLYMAVVLRQGPSMPAAGMYSTPQYDASAITESTVQYSEAPDANGVVQPLLLDIYVPPGATATPRPTVILVHGGSFVGGSRTEQDGDALAFAERGYVGVTIDYRLISILTLYQIGQTGAAALETLDALQSVRWLKANAATYGVDTTRIAMVGSSAGGALALATGVSASATTTGPLAGYSPSIEAAVSNGAFLTPGLAQLTLNANEPGVMMFQYDLDEATHVTSAYAFETCDALRAAGSTCDEVDLAGTGHTTWLVPGGPWWTNELGPFLWNHLRLAS